MKFTEKLVKEITETAYLNQENSNRYRPIMRFFYEKHEQAENWLYKEDVYEELKKYIPDYTIDECQRDLDFLVSKLSLEPFQDTQNATTLEKFKFKNCRYQMTNYAVEIERMTIRLEEMEVKVASLEPRLFERIKKQVTKMLSVETLSEDSCHEIWSDLMNDFTYLNQSYQDFLKEFCEPKTEEVLQNDAFIEYKNNLIRYLNNFIKEYLKYSKEISDILQKHTEQQIKQFMSKLIDYQKKIPQVRSNFDYDYLYQINMGKWQSLRKWFVKTDDISEGDRLLQATNNIIAKTTKFASNLIELHGNMINRKEEYKYLCRLFDKQTSIEASHALASATIGVGTVRHFKGMSNLESDSIIPSYDVKPIEILLDPIARGVKTKAERVPIKDKTLEKQKLLDEYMKEENRKKEIIKKLVVKEKIELIGEIELSKEERKYIFTLLEKGNNKKTYIEGIDPMFGKKYHIEFLDKRCFLQSEDGIFEMNGMNITFGG